MEHFEDALYSRKESEMHNLYLSELYSTLNLLLLQGRRCAVGLRCCSPVEYNVVKLRQLFRRPWSRSRSTQPAWRRRDWLRHRWAAGVRSSGKMEIVENV